MSIEAMKRAIDLLGPEAPTCCGCEVEWNGAISVLRTAIQQAESEPVAGPTTYQQRFTEVVSLLCRAAPPADMVEGWITPDADDHRLQEWAIEHAPNWSQGIGVLDAAHVMADQPAEGEGHETRNTHPAPGVPDGCVLVPLQVLHDASDALGNFIMDHGWGDSDMQAMDNLDAYIARHSALTAAQAQKGQP